MFHADDESQDLSDGWDDILEKAFAKRFDFDCVELRNLYRMSESNATADVPWDDYISNVYIIQRGAFALLVSTSGQCEGLTQWSERQGIGSTSFYVCPEPETMNICLRSQSSIINAEI